MLTQGRQFFSPTGRNVWCMLSKSGQPGVDGRRFFFNSSNRPRPSSAMLWRPTSLERMQDAAGQSTYSSVSLVSFLVSSTNIFPSSEWVGVLSPSNVCRPKLPPLLWCEDERPGVHRIRRRRDQVFQDEPRRILADGDPACDLQDGRSVIQARDCWAYRVSSRRLSRVRHEYEGV